MPSQFHVLLTEEAERDLEDIYRYIAGHDGVSRADYVLARLEDVCAKLIHYPERGNVPKELRSLGSDDYREAHFKPYRIIYQVGKSRVIVYCVADGRRDMRTLLQRRLLR